MNDYEIKVLSHRLTGPRLRAARGLAPAGAPRQTWDTGPSPGRQKTSAESSESRGGATVEELKVINVARTPARFRAVPDDTGITLEGDKPVACIRPILKLLEGHVITRLAADTADEECPRNIDHVRRALALI